MIISHDRQTLFIGVPKNGSQTARAVLGHVGVDLVGEMGRHPTVPEAIRLAEERFPGETISPTAIYAFWRDPVERFCSAVKFHKRCLPNSFIQLFPEWFVGIEPHPRWFEPHPEAIAQDLHAVIDSIPLLDILSALPPPRIPVASLQLRGGKLSFDRPQAEWLHHGITILPFADYEARLRDVVNWFGGDGASLDIPQINAAVGHLPVIDTSEAESVRAHYRCDLLL